MCKAQTKLLQNHQEIEEAEKLGIDIPKEKFRDSEFYFNIDKVDSFYKNDDNGINISINGDFWSLNFNQGLWDKLVKRFS